MQKKQQKRAGGGNVTQGSEGVGGSDPEDSGPHQQDDPQDEGDAGFDEATRAVGEEYSADVFFYSGEIDDVGFGKLTSTVARNKRRDKVLLILTTNGGYANSAYQIARMLQKLYDEFIIFTPSYCKSAGTIVALGATRAAAHIRARPLNHDSRFLPYLD